MPTPLEITCGIMMIAGALGLHYLLIKELIASVRRTRELKKASSSTSSGT
jgi:hypothetical protein